MVICSKAIFMKTLIPSQLIAESGFIALSVDLTRCELLSVVMWRNRHLYLKKEFYVTLVGSLSDQDKVSAEILRAAARSIEFSVELVDEFYYVSKFYESERSTRSSVIVMAKVSGAEEFYASLYALTDGRLKIEPPPHHITLYVGDNLSGKGIGITTLQQLQAFGKKLEPSGALPIRCKLW